MTKTKQISQLILLFTLLVICYLFFSKFLSGKTPKIPIKTNVPLAGVVQKAMDGTKGSYGIAIKNLKSNESFFSNGHKAYTPGSLYKLWIMATTYNQIEDNSIMNDEILSEDVSTLNNKFDIDADYAELTEGTITLSVSDALNQMITISHNYAALLLTEKVKLSSVADFLKNNGFKESTVGINGDSPSTTASDIALFFEKLYKGELADEKYTKVMIDLLKNQQLNDKIPKYLPQEVKIAHKTGEIDTATHDSGIVYTPKGDYIIVVLSDSDFPPAAAERIANLSKEVYNYFTK